MANALPIAATIGIKAYATTPDKLTGTTVLKAALALPQIDSMTKLSIKQVLLLLPSLAAAEAKETTAVQSQIKYIDGQLGTASGGAQLEQTLTSVLAGGYDPTVKAAAKQAVAILRDGRLTIYCLTFPAPGNICSAPWPGPFPPYNPPTSAAAEMSKGGQIAAADLEGAVAGGTGGIIAAGPAGAGAGAAGGAAVTSVKEAVKQLIEWLWR